MHPQNHKLACGGRAVRQRNQQVGVLGVPVLRRSEERGAGEASVWEKHQKETSPAPPPREPNAAAERLWARSVLTGFARCLTALCALDPYVFSGESERPPSEHRDWDTRCGKCDVGLNAAVLAGPKAAVLLSSPGAQVPAPPLESSRGGWTAHLGRRVRDHLAAACAPRPAIPGGARAVRSPR